MFEQPRHEGRRKLIHFDVDWVHVIILHIFASVRLLALCKINIYLALSPSRQCYNSSFNYYTALNNDGCAWHAASIFTILCKCERWLSVTDFLYENKKNWEKKP